MATICYKPPNYCRKCSHYRFDEDYGSMACWLKFDMDHNYRMENNGNEKESSYNTSNATT